MEHAVGNRDDIWSTTTTMTASAPGGTGSSLAKAVVIVSGVSSLVASLLSLVSIWLQTKNYRKPLLQRYVVRILLMVPIYAASSWTSIVSLTASQFLDPVRDVYEAFTIYTFFQLLINFLGGERALIIMTHGRPPVQHAWPLNHVFPKVDISDPHTFLAVKRGILQYTWLKPILALVSIIMKATGTYQEGYLGLTSGYLWTGLVYNVSVTLSLYSLAMFWVCLHDDLKPFRPVPKFLCVKLIIFASYWQGFFLSILQWLGALSNGVAGYTPDNLAAAIQDTLICFEMPFFAITHWYAFSWHDYADKTISAARLPVIYALRDAFGPRDLIEDTKMTLRGENYEYRLFDSGDHIIPHAESASRVKRVMDGMRYERGGKGKYWIPRPGEVNSRTPLLAGETSSGGDRRSNTLERFRAYGDLEESTLDDEDERLFTKARALEFGDWNYPVITANEVPRDQRLGYPRPYQSYQSLRSSGQSSQSSEPVKKARKHRKSRAGSEATHGTEGHRSPKNVKSPRKKSSFGEPGALQRETSSTSHGSRRGQLVDLVVENCEAEEQERVHAQRTLGSAWTGPERRHFERPSGHSAEEPPNVETPQNVESEQPNVESTETTRWEDSPDEEPLKGPAWAYGPLEEENVWNK